MDLYFSVENQIITGAEDYKVVADSRNYLYACFSFSEEWTGVITAVFKNGKTVVNTVLDSDGRCLVPWETIKAGKLCVSCFCGDRITANYAIVKVLPSGYGNGTPPSEPTPDVYADITEKCSEAVSKSETVFTAYENGELKGEKGDKGEPGTTARSLLDLSEGTIGSPIQINRIPSGCYDISAGGWIGSSAGQKIQLDAGNIMMHNNTDKFLTVIKNTGLYNIYTAETDTDWENDCYCPTYKEIQDFIGGV